LLAALFVMVSTPVHAQRIRGTLTDSATHEPLGGALITLTDAKGAYLSRAISDPTGVYAVMRLSATHSMRIARIGFKPRDLVVTSDSIVDVGLQPIAPILPAVATRVNRICTAGPDGDDALVLWDQARTALLATVASREVSPLTVHLHRFRRIYDGMDRRLVVDSSEYDDLTVDRSFVAARSPMGFAQQGYLQEASNGSRIYFAPDEEALTDPTFVTQHCLRRVDDEGAHPGQVGIAFAPIADAAHDTLVDIAGTLWLDREHPALKTLDLHYTNLEPDATASGAVLVFAVMPNGVSMVTNWQITSTRLEVSGLVTSTGYRLAIPRSQRTKALVIGYDQSGGEVVEVDWRDTHRDFATLPQARGQVLDAMGSPVPGVLVWLRDGKDTTRTDQTGSFVLPRTRPGVYYLLAADSLMASEGLAQTIPTKVGLIGSQAPRTTLQFHPRGDVLASICPAKSYRIGTTVLRARVVDSRGRPAENARIELQFGAVNDSLGRVQLPAARRGEADFNGIFTVCGILPTRALVLKAFKDGEGAGIIIDQWTSDIAAVTIPLAPLGKPPF
jgi:hypothetical protein